MMFLKLKFLFSKQTEGFDKKQLFWYGAFRYFMIFMASAGLTVALLFLSFPIGKLTIFAHYFRHPLILLINFLPIFSVMLLCYFLYGKAWPAFLTTAVPFSVLGISNYYKLRFRNDTVIFSDIKDLFLGLSITAEQGYNITPTARILIYLLCVVLGLVFLIFLVPGKINRKKRFKFTPIPAVLLVISILLCTNTNIYASRLVTNGYVWNVTEYNNEHGIVYSFFNSINDAINTPPEGYSKKEMQKLLSSYKEDKIPSNKKVNVFFIMREANNDISDITDAEGIDWSGFDYYKSLEDESYSGKLFTNIFAGGTVNSERCVMTGSYKLKNYTSPTNSYVQYFKSQGYTVEGSHPSNDWYYNRKNMNSNFGFDKYYFIENYYEKIGQSPWQITDKLLYDDLIKQFENRDKSKPYFNFSITFEGHGPYETTSVLSGEQRVQGNYTDYTKNVLSNYLNTMESTNEALQYLVDYFRSIDEPVVLCVFGDHNPWLGDGNSVYSELGINLDLSTEEGLKNYYQTEYLIWANSAAKKAVGSEFTGAAEKTISPCYLMNILFEQCGWGGPSYMKFMNECMEQMPIVSTNSVYSFDGDLVTTLSSKGKKKLLLLEQMNFYWSNNFLYKDD